MALKARVERLEAVTEEAIGRFVAGLSDELLKAVVEDRIGDSELERMFNEFQLTKTT